MYYLNDKEFNYIDDAMNFHLNTEGYWQYDLKDKNGVNITKNLIYTNCKCDNECPKTCLHKKYCAYKTVCHYQWTCECECGCPNQINGNECACCMSDLCSHCYVKINDILGFCKVCIGNNFQNPNEYGYPFTQEQFKFLKDFYILNPEADKDISLPNFFFEYPEIFP